MRSKTNLSSCYCVAFYPNAPEEQLKQRTRAFEARTYTSSASLNDYLNTIAHCLIRVEEIITSSRANAAENQ